jgi:hypothetical protein
MAFILNDVTLGKTHNLATLTLHEDVGKPNRVVYVIVPLTSRVKLATVAQKKTLAKTLAKAALQAAAAAL